MVYSAELGYDPDEWEECPEREQHRLLFSPFTRTCLSIGIGIASAFFFFFLETHNKGKSNGRADEVEKAGAQKADGEFESAETKFARASKQAEFRAQPERRRNSRREWTHEEAVAFLAWKADLERLQVERVHASEERVGNKHVTIHPSDLSPAHTQFCTHCGHSLLCFQCGKAQPLLI